MLTLRHPRYKRGWTAAQESIVTNGKSQTPTVVSSSALGDGWKNMRLK